MLFHKFIEDEIDPFSNMDLHTSKNQSLMCANSKGADQPAHQRRLISAFAIHLSGSIISRLAMRKISIF